jgi:SAM-dependent methyltransferase
MIGAGSFEEIGQQFVKHLCDLCQLRPDDWVLDIGCGIGRIAIPLTGYMTESGQYRGFDIAPASVNWCAKRIAPKFSNFQFVTIDVYSLEYNPTGRLTAEKLMFPYENDLFNTALAASVFTHMRPAGVQRYLGEVRRVLRPGGKCLFTFFILDDASRSRIASGDAQFRFEHEGEGYWSIDSYMPERAIAYDETDVRSMVANAGLNIVEPIHHGLWSGRGAGLNGQDIVVVQRS